MAARLTVRFASKRSRSTKKSDDRKYPSFQHACGSNSSMSRRMYFTSSSFLASISIPMPIAVAPCARKVSISSRCSARKSASSILSDASALFTFIAVCISNTSSRVNCKFLEPLRIIMELALISPKPGLSNQIFSSPTSHPRAESSTRVVRESYSWGQCRSLVPTFYFH
ncbi:hypothetical protein D3C71_1547350 [compost metagenome]